MKKLHILHGILRHTGAYRILLGFGLAFLCAATVLWLWEPGIATFGDGVWYCFVAVTTIGFGDLTAVTPLGRVVTILLCIYGMFVIALTTGVVVSYYNELLAVRREERFRDILDQLERLPELDRAELETLSEKVKRMNSSR